MGSSTESTESKVLREEISLITQELTETLVAKNADYGSSIDKGIDEFGIVSLAMRISDKYNRLKNLSKQEDFLVKEESLRDTLLDLAGYALMGVRRIDEDAQKSRIYN